jgi:subtilisin family serine protease
MSRVYRIAIGLLAAGVLGGTTSISSAQPGDQPIIQNVTPAAWQTDYVEWVRDTLPFDDFAPGNRVDYLIDSSMDASFDIIVNYQHCTDQADIDTLLAISPGAVVQQVGRYITYIALGNVTKAEAQTIASLPGVAFVERQVPVTTTLDVSVKAMKVQASAQYSPQTVADAYPGINGAGVNIAIIDTGVDNTLHQAFAATPFIGGYDAFTQTFIDPDDDHSHGTHVASIALGQAFAGGGPGVAPGAGLIDIKVLDSGGGGTLVSVLDGIQRVYDNRFVWNVGVMNLSLNANAPSDGTETMCQLIDLADSMGICAVIAAGNTGPFNTFLGFPASASRAITVAASEDFNTVIRTDDGIASFSSRGPRASNNNASQIDELKPEVAAPGTSIVAALFNSANGTISYSGTSMAAPHVAGLVALMKQQQPSLNCAMVKCRLIASSTQYPGYPPSLPSVDPIWNKASGWGQVDGYAAIAVASGPDIKFPSYPANPPWLSPDLSTVPVVPQVNVPLTINATIQNPSGGNVSGVRVDFGIHDYSASIPTFSDIGTKIVTLTPGLNVVSLVWTPTSVGHKCLKVSVGSCTDPNAANNQADRNLNISQSPIQFQVRNTVSMEPEWINFVVEAENPDWMVELDQPELLLAGDDCPVEVTALARPPMGTPDGETTLVHIAAYAGGVLLGGVTYIDTMTDCNDNGQDDYFDILEGISNDENNDGVPDECQCPTDFDDDGDVDTADLLFLLGAWGTPAGDVDGDGDTDTSDLLALLGAWGPCP